MKPFNRAGITTRPAYLLPAINPGCASKDYAGRSKIVPLPNDTNAIANASYYKPGTPMTDNIHLFVRPPKEVGGFFTIEDAAKNVLAHGRTIEEIGVEWRRIDTQKVIVEKLVRQGHGCSSQLLNLS